MEIIIKEPRFEFNEKYRIQIGDTEEEFIGANIGFLSFDHIILYRGRHTVIEAKRRFRPFRKRIFDINYQGIKGEFRELTTIKPTYEFVWNNETYEIIEHWGKKTSVFHNSIQVASIVQQNDISFNSNDTFKLLVDDNLDVIPFILIAMILDAPGNGGNLNNLVTIDFGNVAGEKRPFDYKWKPKKK